MRSRWLTVEAHLPALWTVHVSSCLNSITQQSGEGTLSLTGDSFLLAGRRSSNTPRPKPNWVALPKSSPPSRAWKFSVTQWFKQEESCVGKGDCIQGEESGLSRKINQSKKVEKLFTLLQLVPSHSFNGKKKITFLGGFNLHELISLSFSPQLRARKMKCCLLSIALAVLLLVVIIIVVSVKRWPGWGLHR